MLDERWSEETSEIGNALAKLLDAECAPDQVRAAEASRDGRDHALEQKLADFGMSDPDLPIEILTRIAVELGRRLAPVAFVEMMPARLVLGLDATAYGFEGAVPAALSHVAFEQNGVVMAERVNGTARRTAAGDFLVQHKPTGEGATVGDAVSADRMRRLMRLLSAARLVGAGQALLRYGADYACDREQFGKIIGSYQGVAHQLADAATAMDGADLLVRKAAFTASAEAGGDGAPAPIFAGMVHAKTVEAARRVATVVHQVFGGNGFAMEYDVQLYSRRIRSWTARLDRPEAELTAIGRAMLDPAQRDAVRHLWHFEAGLPLPRWAAEADRLAG